MGKCNYYDVGYGMTEREARQDAIETSRDEHGHEEGYSGTISSSTHDCDKSKCLKQPKVAKTCTVDKTVQKGARKWETIFFLSPRWQQNCGTTVTLTDTTQGEAMKEAKRLALKHQIAYRVTIEKRIVGSNGDIAIITPKKSEKGKWAFSGDALC